MANRTLTASARRPSAAERHILVIDANEDHQTLSALALGRHGFRVMTADSGTEGVRLALAHPFDAIVLDHKVRDKPAFEVLEELTERLPHTPMIYVVGAGAEDQAVRALSAGATGYLVKTARYNEVLPIEVEDQIEKARTRLRLEEQTRALAQGVAERERVEEALREFEDRIGLMSEHAPFVLWTMDTDLRFTSSVGSGLKTIGLRPNQVVGQNLQQFAQSDDSDLPLIVSHRRALAGETVRFEQEWQGRIFDVHVEPLRKPGGPILGVFGIALDVTERVRAERVQSALFRISQAAAAAEGLPELFRSIHQIVGELMPAKNFYIALHDPEANALAFPYFVDEAEDPPGPQPLGHGLTEYVLRTGKPLLASPEAFQRLLDAGEVEQVGPNSVDWLGVPLSVKGRVFGVLVVQSYTEGVRYCEAEKDLLQFVCSQIAQVIERKRTEARLQESQALLSTLVSRLPGVAYRCRNDENWTNEFVSEACYDLFGYAPADLIGSRRVSGQDLIHPDDRVRVHREVEAAILANLPYRIVYRIRTSQATEKWVWDQGHAVRDSGGAVVALEGLVTDVTVWRNRTEDLHALEAMRTLFDSANGAVLLVDRSVRILDANPVAEAFFGRERKDLLHRPLDDFLSADNAHRIRERLADLVETQVPVEALEAQLRGPGGVTRRVELRARIVRGGGADPVVEVALQDLAPSAPAAGYARRPFA